MAVRDVVVGVGSNLGAREAAIRCARELLDARDRIAVCDTSPIYETEPLGPPQPHYLNAAFRLQTDLSPPKLLQILLRTERRLGRHRSPERRWGARSIDLDLLWDACGPHLSPGLQVPHTELERRTFALAPFLDVAPGGQAGYRAALERLGGAPKRWKREAIVCPQASHAGFEIEVEADSLADACALSVGKARVWGRPWSTQHRVTRPGPQFFADALRDLHQSGFSVHRASVSHASSDGWNLEFHGVNMGIAVGTHVRLCTTSGAKRAFRAQLSLSREPA